ncbi:MAG TPA: hypothetical protein VFJ57_02495 [Solirubrobacterales bacterium]|nr:hypothetical protein [Solirubrobacterales bacterium]
MRRWWLVAGVVSVALALPASAGAEFAQPGWIEGVVSVAPGGTHVEGIEVCANAEIEEEENFTQCQQSKADGSYEVTGLPEGKYRVSFSSGESGLKLVTQYWRNVTTPGPATLIQIGEGQQVTNINAELQPAAGSIGRPQPKILSASWGTENAVGCPNGTQGLDNIPTTFNWFIRRASIQPADFRIVRSDGTVAKPTCALQFPPNEADEAQTVNLIGDFGDAASGPTPVAIRVVGALQGKAPGAPKWHEIKRLPKVKVDPLSGGPYIVDVWTLMPSIYRGDQNRCAAGKTFVRVMWSNGLTAYPTGEEVGAPVTASYRALYELPNGKTLAKAPLEVADLHDHESSFNADNMHDLCLPKLPRGARLTGVTIAANLIQDPNGDPNPAQKFRVRG